MCIIFPKVKKSQIARFPFYYLYRYLAFDSNNTQNPQTLHIFIYSNIFFSHEVPLHDILPTSFSSV